MLPQYLECLTALQDQSNKLLFGHFLRNESGRGDTIDKLKYLHEILEDFNKHQRIINASEIVPLLLKIYFKIVINFGNKELLSELINVLLERVLCLYNETTFQEEVRQVMAEKLVDIFQTHPSLLIEKFQEVKEFFNNYRILKTSNGEFYIHLVWIVGEFAHTGYDVRCTADKLSLFYETLEMIGYEISYNLGQYSGYTLRLIMVLMNTLAKLASRCQDLIPRTLLCLNKIVNQSIQNVPQLADRKLMYTRMNELSNILKMPSVASAVLTPVPNCCDPHQISHQMNIATIMQSTTHLITGNNPVSL
jgi:AP-5 complex subunit zeta-1